MNIKSEHDPLLVPHNMYFPSCGMTTEFAGLTSPMLKAHMNMVEEDTKLYLDYEYRACNQIEVQLHELAYHLSLCKIRLATKQLVLKQALSEKNRLHHEVQKINETLLPLGDLSEDILEQKITEMKAEILAKDAEIEQQKKHIEVKKRTLKHTKSAATHKLITEVKDTIAEEIEKIIKTCAQSSDKIKSTIKKREQINQKITSLQTSNDEKRRLIDEKRTSMNSVKARLGPTFFQSKVSLNPELNTSFMQCST